MAEAKPCVGCGWCCKRAPCAMAVRLCGNGINETGCPYLVYRDGRYWCGAVERASGPLREQIIEELAIGAGCCCPMNGDRRSIPAPEAAAADIDWRRAFMCLARAVLAEPFMSSDTLNLMLMRIGHEYPEAGQVFRGMFPEHRNTRMKEFMG